jgi:integrase
VVWINHHAYFFIPMMSEKLWLNCAGIKRRMIFVFKIRTACRLAGIEGLIWKDLRATFGTRLAEAGCDAFTIAQLLGHSDVRVTMRYVRAVEDTKRAAVEAIKLSARKNVQVLASWQKSHPSRRFVSR